MASPFTKYGVQAHFSGVDEIARRLRIAVDRIERGTMRDALNKSAKPMLKASRDNARLIQRSGTLRKSLKKKTTTDVRTSTVSVFIGPDRKVVSGDYGGKHTPANIVHLIEFEWQHRSGKQVQGKHFLEDAFNKTKDDSIRIYHRELRSSLEKITARFQKKDPLLR